MASGKTDNLMTAILAHGKDPVTGEYLTAKQRKELFKKSKISGSKVFGGGGGRNFRGGGGGRTGGLAGGALALRDPSAITSNDISQKLDNILALLKADADSERRYKEALFEKQRQAREKLLRGSAETKLEGKDVEQGKKVEKAKKGMQVQIPFLEKLAKFLMIYLAGWTTDKLINMFSAKADGNIAKLLEYRDVLINQLGKFFAPVANIANGFAIWIGKTVARIGGWAGRIGKKVFTKFFGMVRNVAIGMLNKLKSLVQNPIKAVTTAAKDVTSRVLNKGADLLKRVPGSKVMAELTEKAGVALGGLKDKAGKVAQGLKPGQILKRATDPIKNLLGKAAGPLSKGLKSIVKGNLFGVLLTQALDVRERLGKGQSPTQALLAGLLYGIGSGVVSGTITSALTTAIPGLGLPLGLLLGGWLGDKAGGLLTRPVDDYFSTKREPNEFDKWFTNWANNSDDTLKGLLGWDRRMANAGTEPALKQPKANDPGAGTGDMTRVSPGGALQNSAALTPLRTGAGRSAPSVIPMTSGSPQPPQQIPNKSLVTNIPAIESTNYDNPYLPFSYSVYNVLV